MVVNRKICPGGLKGNPNRLMKSIDYITIHTTANYKASATAKAHADFQYGGGSAASWHYTVDKDEIWQSFEDNSECWHAGDGSGPGNSNSIAIEICVNDKNGFKQACENAAWLAASLVKKHNLSLEKIVQHNKWSGKNCPSEIRSDLWGVSWEEFLSAVEKYLSDTENNTGAVESGTSIAAEPKVGAYKMALWAKSKNAASWLLDLSGIFFCIARDSGVSPELAYCQAAKTMNYGWFGGSLDVSYRNPGGIRNSKGEAFERFKSWDDGIQAQVDHLALYAGMAGYPKSNSPDPRHFSSIAGTAITVEQLGGKWASGSGYGEEIVEMMKNMEAI